MSLGPDLLLDTETWDLDLSTGDAQLTGDLDQAIGIRLKFFAGEWFLNTEVGIPYRERIFVKNPQLDQIAVIYREEIAATPGVTNVLDVTPTLNARTRELSVTWRAEGEDGVVAGVVGDA